MSSEKIGFQIEQRGETTFPQLLNLASAALDLAGLVNEVAGHLAAHAGERHLEPIAFRLPFILVHDGDNGGADAPWSATCDEACARSIPAFFGSPASIIFLCRTCGARVCWRHAHTDATGGWCMAHRPAHENPQGTNFAREGG